MEYLPLNKRILIVSTWAPPRPGGSAQHLYNFYSQFNPAQYAIFTRAENMHAEERGPQLLCAYHFFPRSALRAVKEGMRIVRYSGTEVIYGTADSGRGLLLAFLLSLLSRRPLLLHFFDIYRGNSFPAPWGLASWLFEPLLILYAKRTILPNEAIYDEYCRRYAFLKRRFICVNNGTFDTPYDKLRTGIVQHGKPYRIVCTGSVYWAQEESVRCLAEAVRGAENLRVELYTPRRIQDDVARIAEGNANVSAASAEPSRMPEIQTLADLLFIPLARPGVSPVVTNTAVPGRLPEYLLSGRPLIVHAPEGSFMARYARREKFAHVVESFEPSILKEEIYRVIRDIDYQRRLAESGISTFKKFHDARQNARLIAEVINSLPTRRRA